MFHVLCIMFHILCSVFKSSAFHFFLLWVSGSVFRPQGPGSGAQGSRFRVQCPVVRVQDPVSRVQVTGSMVSSFGLRAQVAGFQVGTEFRSQGSWFRISGSGLRLQGSERVSVKKRPKCRRWMRQGGGALVRGSVFRPLERAARAACLMVLESLFFGFVCKVLGVGFIWVESFLGCRVYVWMVES